MPFFSIISLLFFWQVDGPELQREYHYKHWQVGQLGLISNAIRSIEQDPFGYIWVATFSGLQRFDGMRFESFSDLVEPRNGLSSNQTTLLFRDSKNYLWVGTFNKGLNRLDPRTLEIKRFINDPEDPTSLSANRISSVTEDIEGYLWIATISGLNRLHPETLEIKRFFLEDLNNSGREPNFLTSVFADSRGQVWVGSYAGLFKYHSATESFSALPVVRTPGRENANLNITWILEGDDNQLFLATHRDGLLLYDPQGDSRHLPAWEGKSLYSLIKDRQERLWQGFYNEGLGVFDPRNNTQRSPLSSASDPDSLYKKTILCLFEDQSGALWIGTEENGLYQFHPKTAAFHHFNIASQNASKSEKDVFSTAPGSGNYFWVGNGKGDVFSVNQDTFTKETILPSPYERPVHGILEDQQNRVWVGFHRSGLLRFDVATGKQKIFAHKPGQARSLSNNAVNAMVESQQGDIWIGTNSGLNRYQPQTESFERFRKSNYGDAGLENDVIYALLADQKGGLWLGNSNSQVHYLDPKQMTFKRIDVSQVLGLDEFDLRVNALSEGQHGEIYVGIFGDGLKKIDPVTHEVTALEGGPAFIEALVTDENNHLWISSRNSGLFRYDPQDKSMDSYVLEHGLQALNFSRGAGSRLSQGHLLFGGIDGFNVFDPNEVALDSQPPFVFFKSFLASGEPVPSFQLATFPQIATPKIIHELSHRQNTLTVEFLGLHVPNPESNRYEHRLEPDGKSWLPIAPGQKQLTFYSLRPGNYQLALRAANVDSHWTPEPIYLNFVVKPPRWKSRCALFAYSILGVAIIWFLIWRRIKTLRKRAFILETQVRQRTREIQDQKDTIEGLLNRQKTLFANISHEFRTPLTLILGPLEHLLKTGGQVVKKPAATIRGNAVKLLRMVDQILDLSRLANRGVSPTYSLNASQHLDQLLDAFDGTFQTRKLHLARDIAPDCWIEIPADSFEKVVLNLLSNAVKYTPDGGTIRAELSVRENLVVLAISDTGMGIPEKDLTHIFERFYRSENHQQTRIPGAGIGLALVKELTELHDGEIHVSSTVGEGTCFTLRFAVAPPGDTLPEPEANTPEDSALEMEISVLEEADIQEEEATKPEDRKSSTILIIEDHPGMRSYIHSELAQSYRCYTAHQGQEGLAMAKRLIPDLIISDVMMPGMDGYQVTHALKTHAKTSHIPVILLTARGDQESLISGIREGADAYLTKPFNTRELIYRIENLLSVREILKKRYAVALIAGDQPPPQEKDSRNPLDTEFLEKFQELLSENYPNPDFNLKDMVSSMAMSERPLQRKLKALTDYTPSQYLRLFRLKRAASMLQSGHKSSDVAFSVGFSSHAYFSACFKAQFSLPPSAYAQQESS